MRAIIFSAVAASGQRTMFASTAAGVTVRGSTSPPTSRSCTRCTQATISTGPAAASTLRAITPAATRPTVSRALARPPPCQARMPYLAL